MVVSKKKKEGNRVYPVSIVPREHLPTGASSFSNELVSNRRLPSVRKTRILIDEEGKNLRRIVKIAFSTFSSPFYFYARGEVTRVLSEGGRGLRRGWSARKGDARAKNREGSCERRSREFNDIPDYAGTWREKRREGGLRRVAEEKKVAREEWVGRWNEKKGG